MSATEATKTTTRRAPIPRFLRERAEEILAREIDFMDSAIYRRKNIEAELFGDDAKALPLVSWYQPTRDDASDGEKTQTPQLMSADEEKLMFMRFNFTKRKLKKTQRRAQRDGLTKKLAQELVDLAEKAEFFREYLVRTNLALVLAMAKRTRLGDVDFAEIVSEGNMALIRAVDKFNVDKGFKFSTYACRAILKAFSRTSLKHSRHKSRFPVEFEPDLEKSNWDEVRRDQVEDDCVDELREIVNMNRANLTDVEATVIRRRFNWEGDTEKPLTLEEVGRIIGVTKERVRQIQNKALVKIRRTMEDGVLRTQKTTEEATADTLG
ncbi:MAG: sigma-70 family RNA polymerase sigma factor [Phycisphaerae bacterium]